MLQHWIAELEPNKQVVRELERRQHDQAFINEVFPPGSSRLEFGTAGLRAEFGPGLLRMNEVVVAQTCQGILHQLLSEFGAQAVRERGICIGYDHRQSPAWGLSSKRFALVAAAVFAKHVDTGALRVFDGVNPTPFVPYAVQKYGALAGFMFTASHNPKQDAGFKVYWSNACQITSPLDGEIRHKIALHLDDASLRASLLEVKQQHGDDDAALCLKYLTPGLHATVQRAYLDSVHSKLYRAPPVAASSSSSLPRICYTAMHGCGQDTALKLFARFGLLANIAPVPSQAEPDFDFPTVRFPNPEEKGALDVAMQFASSQEGGCCSLILANDPDADRLGVAEWNPATGAWVTLTGDEIAMLLAWWELTNLAAKTKQTPPKAAAMVVSAVSSAFLSHLGSKYGVEVFEALTGFKWIGAKAIELRERQGYDVLLSYEEAIGFCVGDNVPDKDGISAAAVFAQLYLALRLQQASSCLDKLDELRREHGYFITQNLYVKLSPAQQQQVFDQLRARTSSSGEALLVGKLRPRVVTRVRDLERRTDTSLPPGQEPALPFSANMITYYLDGGERITLRASGTEPKLKYYVECVGKTLEEARARCEEVVSDVVLGDLLVVTGGGGNGGTGRL